MDNEETPSESPRTRFPRPRPNPRPHLQLRTDEGLAGSPRPGPPHLRIHPAHPRRAAGRSRRLMEKAAIEVPKSIAEGFKRRGSRNKAHYYNLSQSALESLRYLLILCRDLKYDIDYDDLAYRGDQVSRMLDGLIRSMTRGGTSGGGGGGRGRRGGAATAAAATERRHRRRTRTPRQPRRITTTGTTKPNPLVPLTF